MPTSGAEFTTSFRDPGGRLFRYGDRVFRAVNAAGKDSLRRFLDCRAAQPFLDAGSIVQTRFLEDSERNSLADSAVVSGVLADVGATAVVEHQAAPFVNYPHEWPAEMLHAAGLLTLDLALSLLSASMGLKDATPSNVMFWGPKPVFLDLLSFERRDPLDPTWLAYAQFVRTFLLPLFVNRRYQIPLARTFGSRDGLEPEDVYPLLNPLERLRPRNFSLITFPVWARHRAAAADRLYHPRRLHNPEQALFVITSLLRRQRRALQRFRPGAARGSVWSGYMAGNHNYSASQFNAKQDLVRGILARTRPSAVLDIGCNTGTFSFIAAEAGARVVAVDSDPVVIGRLWSEARARSADILPLVVDIARPTPAMGWANQESRSFLNRAEGAFDTVLMLALVHHLVVTERVPLPEIFGMARRLARKWLIVEYIGPSDSMFLRLTRGREHLHHDYGRDAFETAAERFFRIVCSEEVPGTDRRLYWLSTGD